MSEREAAVGALADSLKRRYPRRGFLIHPSLTFVDAAAGGGGGIEARVTSALPRDEILLVIPESARLSAMTIAVAAGSDADHAEELSVTTNEGQDIIVPYSSRDGGDGRKAHRPGGGVRLSELLAKVEKKYHRTMVASDELERGRTNYGGNNLAIYDASDVALAVCVMYAAANPGWWSEQVATWPSREAVRNMPLYWDDSDAVGDGVMDILGEKTAVREQIAAHQEALRIGFKRVVLPLLSDVWGHFVLPNVQNGGSARTSEDELWESYRYAFTIGYTRCHEGHEEPGLMPLVDLINGLPDLCGDGDAGINVKIASGFWPFIHGDKFVNECNLPCSSVYATRDLKEGESLFISYGDLSPCNFLSKYGTVPPQLLHHPEMADSVNIWCPPDLLPDPMDGPRIQALRNAGYPVTAEEHDAHCISTLDRESYEVYQRGGRELRGVGSLKQFLILAHLVDDSAVQLNLSTGRLRYSNVSSFDVCRILGRVIDYNLERLSAEEENSNSADDVKLANDPHTQPSNAAALLGRVGQRETLAKWRHAFCRKYGIPSHADATTSEGIGRGFECPPCLSGGACHICGRTVPSLKCSRCKLVCYCSREHQRLDWKVHKRVCMVPS